MADIKNHRRALYNAIKDKFKVSNETDDEKAFAEFDKKMNDPVSRQKFYDQVSRTYNIGTREEFERRIASPDGNMQPQGGSTLDNYTFGANKPASPATNTQPVASPTPSVQMKPASVAQPVQPETKKQPVTSMQPQGGSTPNITTGEAVGTVAGETAGTVTQPQTENVAAVQSPTEQPENLYQSYEEAHPEQVMAEGMADEEWAFRLKQQRQQYEEEQRQKRTEARRKPVQEFYTTYMKPVFDKIRQRGKQQIAEAASKNELYKKVAGGIAASNEDRAAAALVEQNANNLANEKYDDPQKVIDEVLNQFLPASESITKGKQVSSYEQAQRVRNNRMMTQLVYNQIGMNPDESDRKEETDLHDLYDTWTQAGLKLGDEATFMRNIKDKAWREAFYDQYLKGKVGFTLEQFNNEIDPPQLSEDELRKIQNRYNTEFSEMTSDLQQMMLDEYKKEEAPKNWLEYIAGNAMRENMIGKLLDILNQKAAGSSGLRRQLRREAMQQFGEDSNWFVRTAGELSPLFVDTAIQLPFLLPGLAGRGVTMGIQQVGGALVKNNATAQLANLSRSAAFAQWMAETTAAKRFATNMAIRSLSGAANFATLNAQNYALEAWGNGQFNTDEFAETVWEGVKTGLGAGVVGNIFGKKFNSKMGNIAMQTGGVLSEALVFSAEDVMKLMESGQLTWDNSKDAVTNYLQNVVMVLGMRVQNRMMHGKQPESSKELGAGAPMTAADRDILEKAGYYKQLEDVQNRYKDGLAQLGPNLGFDERASVVNSANMARRQQAEARLKAEYEAGMKNLFKQISENKNLPVGVRKKLGLETPTAAVMDVKYEDGVDVTINGKQKKVAAVTLLDGNGNVITRKFYDTMDDAKKENAAWEYYAKMTSLQMMEQTKQQNYVQQAFNEAVLAEDNADIIIANTKRNQIFQEVMKEAKEKKWNTGQVKARVKEREEAELTSAEKVAVEAMEQRIQGLKDEYAKTLGQVKEALNRQYGVDLDDVFGRLGSIQEKPLTMNERLALDEYIDLYKQKQQQDQDMFETQNMTAQAKNTTKYAGDEELQGIGQQYQSAVESLMKIDGGQKIAEDIDRMVDEGTDMYEVSAYLNGLGIGKKEAKEYYLQKVAMNGLNERVKVEIDRRVEEEEKKWEGVVYTDQQEGGRRFATAKLGNEVVNVDLSVSGKENAVGTDYGVIIRPGKPREMVYLKDLSDIQVTDFDAYMQNYRQSVVTGFDERYTWLMNHNANTKQVGKAGDTFETAEGKKMVIGFTDDGRAWVSDMNPEGKPVGKPTVMSREDIYKAQDEFYGSAKETDGKASGTEATLDEARAVLEQSDFGKTLMGYVDEMIEDKESVEVIEEYIQTQDENLRKPLMDYYHGKLKEQSGEGKAEEGTAGTTDGEATGTVAGQTDGKASGTVAGDKGKVEIPKDEKTGELKFEAVPAERTIDYLYSKESGLSDYEAYEMIQNKLRSVMEDYRKVYENGDRESMKVIAKSMQYWQEVKRIVDEQKGIKEAVPSGRVTPTAESSAMPEGAAAGSAVGGQEKPQAKQVIPVDKKGNKRFEAVPAERTIEYLYGEESGFSADDATALVSGRIEMLNKNYKKALKSGDIDAAKDLKDKINYWQEVLEKAKKAKTTEQPTTGVQQPTTEQTPTADEEQVSASMGDATKYVDALIKNNTKPDAIRQAIAQLEPGMKEAALKYWSSVEGEYLNRRARRSEGARKARATRESNYAKRALAIEAYDLESIVQKEMIGAKFIWDNEGGNTKGLGEHLFGHDRSTGKIQDQERRNRQMDWLASREKGGLTPEEFADKVWQHYYYENEQYTPTDILNVVIDTLRRNHSYKDVLEELEQRYRDRDDEETRYQKEQYALSQGFDSWDAYVEFMTFIPEEDMLNIPANEEYQKIYNNFAEQYEAEDNQLNNTNYGKEGRESNTYSGGEAGIRSDSGRMDADTQRSSVDQGSNAEGEGTGNNNAIEVPESAQGGNNAESLQRGSADNGGRSSSQADGNQVGYKVSERKDSNGLPFVLTKEGKEEFGEITEEVSQKSGLPAAPILFSEGKITNEATKDGFGLVHVVARHGSEIKAAGYESVIDFVKEVATDFDKIRLGNVRDGKQTYLLQKTDTHDNTLIVELSNDGKYWYINTAGIFKESYGAKKPEIYNRHTTVNQSAETDGQSLDAEQGGTPQSTSMVNDHISGGKDTNNSANNQIISKKNAASGDVVATVAAKRQQAESNVSAGMKTGDMWMKAVDEKTGDAIYYREDARGRRVPSTFYEYQLASESGAKVSSEDMFRAEKLQWRIRQMQKRYPGMTDISTIDEAMQGIRERLDGNLSHTEEAMLQKQLNELQALKNMMEHAATDMSPERARRRAELDHAQVQARIERIRQRMGEFKARSLAQGMVDQLQTIGMEVSTDIAEMREAEHAYKSKVDSEGVFRGTDAERLHKLQDGGNYYGFVVGGKIYLDPRKLNPESVLHEYTHLWASALRIAKPKVWLNIVEMMKKDETTWDYVKQLYPELNSDEAIADEVLARYSGKRGAQRLQDEMSRLDKRNNISDSERSKMMNAFNNIKKAIQDFWKNVGSFLHIDYKSAEEVADQVLKDFVSGTNVENILKKEISKLDGDYLKAVENGDEAKATELFNEALRLNVGNGTIPYISAAPYLQVRNLAHKVKSGDAEAIKEAAQKMAPLVPANAVLIPIPSRTGKATNMLALANAIAEATGAEVKDILTGESRESLYEMKKRGATLALEDLGIKASETIPSDKIPIFIDNVVDTGLTAEAAVKSVGRGIVLTLGSAVDRYKHSPGLKYAKVVVEDKGRVIPLSERFTLGKRDIRYHREDVSSVSETETIYPTSRIEFEKMNEQRMEEIMNEFTDIENRLDELDEAGQTNSAEYRQLEDRLFALDEEYKGLKQINRMSAEIRARENDKVSAGVMKTEDGKKAAWVQLSLDFDDNDRESVANQTTNSTPNETETAGEAAGTAASTEQEAIGEDLTQMRLRPLKAGERSYVERRYVENKGFSFTGGEKVTSPDDVAYIFRSLEDSAIENTFLVLIKDGKATIIHTGMGAMAASPVDAIAARLAVDNMKPSAVIMVHNHPSGNLRPSTEDRNIHRTLKGIYGDILQDSIIIDQKSGRYAAFNEMGTQSEAVRPTQVENESEYKVFSFSQNVFAKDYDFDANKLTNASDIAAFVSSQRLGDRGKLGVLILSNSGKLNGNVFLPFNKLEKDNINEITKQLASDAAAMSGRSVILFGSGSIDAEQAAALKGSLQKQNIRLLDAVRVEGNKDYDSLAENGVLEPEAEYGTRAEKIRNNLKIAEENGEDAEITNIKGEVSGVKHADGTVEMNVKTFEEEKEELKEMFRDGGWNEDEIDAITYDDNGELIPLSERFNAERNDLRFMEGENKPTFYSNAEKAVMDVKQEKATAEQWLKMIQKVGGLKAEEDKWMGLSEWLASKRTEGNTVTKQEILDFIRENNVQVEDVTYSNMHGQLKQTLRNLNDEFDRFKEEAKRQSPDGKEVEAAQKAADDFGDEMYDKYGAAFYNKMSEDEHQRFSELTQIAREKKQAVNKDVDDAAWDMMLDKYGDDFELGFYHEVGKIYAIDENDGETPSDYVLHFMGTADKPIYDVRLGYTTDGLENKKEIALVVPGIEPWNQSDNIHFGDAGEGRAVAWIRFGEAIDKDGKRVLVIDEIQSKRHQEGREKGYKDSDIISAKEKLEKYVSSLNSKYGNDWFDNASEVLSKEEYDTWDALWKDANGDGRLQQTQIDKVPDAPFRKNWHELAMKRILRYAAENGYDKIAWTTGTQQAERYNLSQKLDALEYAKNEDGTYYVSYILKGHRDGHSIGSRLTEKELVDNLDKELASKIVNGEKTREREAKSLFGNKSRMISVIEGDNLTVGGEGMKGFYDKMLPQFMDKYGKKWGVKTGEVELDLPNEGDRKMWSVDVTPEMKKSVMGGQPMFMDAEKIGFDVEKYDKEHDSEFGQFLEYFRDRKNDKNPVKRHFVFGDTGDVLHQYGMTGKITIDKYVFNNRHSLDAHELDESDWINVALSINDPVAILKYKNRKNSFRLYTTAVVNGQNICVGVDVNRVGYNLDVTNIRTAFGREPSRIVNSDEELLYSDENKIKQILNQFSVAPNSRLYGQESVTGGKDKVFFVIDQINLAKNADATENFASQFKNADITVIRSEKELEQLDIPESWKEQIKNGKAGFYDVQGKKSYVYMPNVADEATGRKAVMHEAVAHYGLRELIGHERFDKEMLHLLSQLPSEVKKEVLERAHKMQPDATDLIDWAHNRDQYRAAAMDEYLADHARDAETPQWWDKVKGAVRTLLRNLGFDMELTDGDVKYMLWRSAENLRGNRGLVDTVLDKAMRLRYGVDAAAGRQHTEQGFRGMDAPERSTSSWMDSPTLSDDFAVAGELNLDAAAEAPGIPHIGDEDVLSESSRERVDAARRDVEAFKADRRAAEMARSSEPIHKSIRDAWSADKPKRSEEHQRMKAQFTRSYNAAMKKRQEWMRRWQEIPAGFGAEGGKVELPEDLKDMPEVPVMSDELKKLEDEYNAQVTEWYKNKQTALAEDMAANGENGNKEMAILQGGVVPPDGGDGDGGDYFMDGDEYSEERMQEFMEEAHVDATPEGVRNSIWDSIYERRTSIDHDEFNDNCTIARIRKALKPDARKKLLFVLEGDEDYLYRDTQEYQRLAQAKRDYDEAKQRHNAAQEPIKTAYDFGELKEKYPPSAEDADLSDTDYVIKLFANMPEYAELEVINKEVEAAQKAFDAYKKTDTRVFDPELKKQAEIIRAWFDDMYTAMKMNGLFTDETSHLENYVTHIWDFDNSFLDHQQYMHMIRRQHPSVKHRVINTIREGLDLGLKLKYDDVTDIMKYYSHAANEAIANRRFIDSLRNIYVEHKIKGAHGTMMTAKEPLIARRVVDGKIVNRMGYSQIDDDNLGNTYLVMSEYADIIDKVFASKYVFSGSKKSMAAAKREDKFFNAMGALKKANLSWSFFHHVALTESMMANTDPVFTLKVITKDLLFDSIKAKMNGELSKPAYMNKELTDEALKHHVKLSSSSSYLGDSSNDMVSFVDNILKKVVRKDGTSMFENGISDFRPSDLLRLPTATLSKISEGLDTMLWDYVHDTYKMKAYEYNARQVKWLSKKRGWSKEQQNKMLDEVGQWINDTFGGQNMELIGVSKRLHRGLGMWLMSADYTVSTRVRQPFANLGFGVASNHAPFWSLENAKNHFKGKEAGTRLYLAWKNTFAMGAEMIVGYCLLNALMRSRDKDEQERIAEEMRKTDPEYKSPYDIAYPDGMTWKDYLPTGNAYGQRTHVFIGRDAEGRELYARVGKQAREYWEWAYDSEGNYFPLSLIQKAKNTLNPTISALVELTGGALDARFANKDITEAKTPTDKMMAMGRTAVLSWVPFSLRKVVEKPGEWSPVDLFMPTTKGMSMYKARTWAEEAMKMQLEGADTGDKKLREAGEEQWEAVRKACIQNGVDFGKIMDYVEKSINLEERKEYIAGIDGVEAAVEAFDNPQTSLEQRRALQKYIQQEMNNKPAKAVEYAEAKQRALDIVDGVDVEANDNYDRLKTSEDMLVDIGIKQEKDAYNDVHKQYIDAGGNIQLTGSGKKRDPEWSMRRTNTEIDRWYVLNYAQRKISELKKEMGEGKDNEKILEKMRRIRKAANEWGGTYNDFVKTYFPKKKGKKKK